METEDKPQQPEIPDELAARRKQKQELEDLKAQNTKADEPFWRQDDEDYSDEEMAIDEESLAEYNDEKREHERQEEEWRRRREADKQRLADIENSKLKNRIKRVFKKS